MLAQHQGTRLVQATAEALPFPDKAFDAAMAIMTVHHWTDLDAGLAEMCRVAQRQVIFTWDKEHDEELWIISEYVPEIRVMEHARFPCLDARLGAGTKTSSSATPSTTAIGSWAAPNRRISARSRDWRTNADTNHGIIRWCGPSCTTPTQYRSARGSRRGNVRPSTARR